MWYPHKIKHPIILGLSYYLKQNAPNDYVTYSTWIVSSTAGMFSVPKQYNSVFVFDMLRTQQPSVEEHGGV